MTGEAWEWYRPLVLGLISACSPFLVVLLAANMLRRGADPDESRGDPS